MQVYFITLFEESKNSFNTNNGLSLKLMLTQVCIMPSFNTPIYVTPHHHGFKNKPHGKTRFRWTERVRSHTCSPWLASAGCGHNTIPETIAKTFLLLQAAPRESYEDKYAGFLKKCSWLDFLRNLFRLSSQSSKGTICLQGNSNNIFSRDFKDFFPEMCKFAIVTIIKTAS